MGGILASQGDPKYVKGKLYSSISDYITG